MEIIPLLLIALICGALILGYPVAFTLAGVSILYAFLGIQFGFFEENLLRNIPIRIFGIMNNQTLLAVPLFVLMGVILERSGIAAKMLQDMAAIFRGTPSGLSISIIVVGALLAASTGIVGATVVTMGLMSLPALIKQGYSKEFSSGLVASTGTLGQIIPPSIALVLLGDVMTNAYQRAQNNLGIFSQKTVSVGDLFVGAIIPGIMIIIGYLAYAQEIASAMLRRQQATAIVAARHKIVEGAVGMVEMALDQLQEKDVVELDEEKKAAMVSNLMVVLCADKEVAPVVNSGTLNH